MRTAFVRALTAMAASDPRVTLVVGDLGYSVIEEFATAFPRQYVNIGVAEQNMTGVAAGLAMAGRVVFTYSIANFPTLRCLEQIRNDVCYHGLSVNVVAVGGGFAYGALGASHHATEDLAIMRALPGLTVVAPGDPVEARLATRALATRSGPGYLRLGKSGEPVVHQAEPDFALGRAIRVREGRHLTMLAIGGMLPIASAAAEALSQTHGVEARVLSMHTLKPFDHLAVQEAARETGVLLTIEEHSVLGGLGGATAEVLAEMDDARPKFRRIGIESKFLTAVGDQTYLRRQAGLTTEAVVATALTLVDSGSATLPRA